MKKLILLGIIAVVALAGIYYFFPQAFQPAADNQPKRFSSAEELNAFINASSETGFYGGSVMSNMAVGAPSASGAAQKSVSDISQAPQSGLGESNAPSSGGSIDYSQTNIQVAGVDESDIVKTDGKYIYAVSGNKVSIIDAYPAESAKIVSTLEFNGTVGEIYISKDRLVVFGQESYQYAISKTVLTGGGTGAEPKLAVSVPEKSSESIMRPYYYSPSTFINVYDISDRNSPVLSGNVSVGGSYYDSRMIGDYVFVIANQPVYNYGGGPVPLPVIRSNGAVREIPATDIYYFGMPDSSFVFTNIVSVNVQTGGEVSSKTFLMGYSESIYVSLNNIYLAYQKRVSEIQVYGRIIDEVIIPSVPQDVKNKIAEIRSYNISEPNKMEEIGKIFENYISSLNPEQAAGVMKDVQGKLANLMNEITKETEKTVIHKISIDGGKIEYKTNGEVPGQPLNQFSMDESSGYFRIATTTTNPSGGMLVSTGAIGNVRSAVTEQTTATVKQLKTGTEMAAEAKVKPVVSQPALQGWQQPLEDDLKFTGPLNHLYILDGGLKIVGKLEDMAAGERIYSVRFLGDKAYMVTFRLIDPLFVIDLSSPQNPKVIGYLKIPGVSDYLHPYDETHVIGVGSDATEQGRITGMKLSLFDVSDFANPSEVSKYIIGDRGTSSDALYDHKAFLFDKGKNLLVIPVSEYTAVPAEVKPEWQWESKYWQGAYVFNLDLTNGFALKGKITHQNSTENSTYYYDWNSQIRRSLFINNTLYTVSNSMVKMNSLSDLSEKNKIELPVQTEYPYRIY